MLIKKGQGVRQHPLPRRVGTPPSYSASLGSSNVCPDRRCELLPGRTFLIKPTLDQISQQTANDVDHDCPEQLHHRHHLLLCRHRITSAVQAHEGVPTFGTITEAPHKKQDPVHRWAFVVLVSCYQSPSLIHIFLTNGFSFPCIRSIRFARVHSHSSTGYFLSHAWKSFLCWSLSR